MNINRVILSGNLVRDPELRYTQSGRPVANFTIAVNRQYRTASGDLVKSADFLRVVAWGKQAENIAEYLGKGRSITVEGRLASRSYESNGQRRYITEVVAQNVTFGPRPRSEAEPEAEAEVAVESEVTPATDTKAEETF
ncbi:single-stranded DNA-binding protein [Candidatus Woesearchaeota archaeon]|nr:MAG: single-stranded DNA-binding protein [Candidatus Woesearchaeota archaeon]